LKATLADIGFCKGVISEVILSTYNLNKEPNSAPIGMTMVDEQHLTADIYNTSSTCRSLKQNKYAVINITGNIEVFYRSAIKEANPSGRLPSDWFKNSRGVNAPRLRLADATVEVSAQELVPLANGKTHFLFNVESIHAPFKYPQAYSRALPLTVEAIIHATRVKALANDQTQQKKLDELLGIIESYSEIVCRVAPTSSCSLVIADLTRRIDVWRKKP
jgi:hypothetical protein